MYHLPDFDVSKSRASEKQEKPIIATANQVMRRLPDRLQSNESTNDDYSDAEDEESASNDVKYPRAIPDVVMWISPWGYCEGD
jgi:hypothetical protein